MKTGRTAFILILISVLIKPINFLKEIIIAAIFGAGISRDAFLVAWQVPNVIGGFVFEGLPQIFVPWLTELRQRKNQDNTLNSLINIFILALFFISITVFFTSSFWISIIAPFLAPETKAIASILLQIMSFSILFMGVSAVFTGVLYSNQKFIIPLFTVPLMSLTAIAFIISGSAKYGIYALAFGVLIGSIAAVILQMFQVKGIKYKPTIIFDKELINFLVLSSTFFIGTLIFNLNAVVEKIFASSLPVGSISYLDYAFRITQVFFTIFIPVTTVIFPKLCDMAINPELKENFVNLLTKGIKTIIFLVLPIVALLVSLRVPLVSIIYQRGVFSSESTIFTANLMGIYALGLIPHSLNYLLIHIFYTQKEMSVRVKYGLIFLLSDIILNLIFIDNFGMYGIAMANTLAALISTIFLGITVNLRVRISMNEFFNTFCKVSVISLAIYLVSWWIWNIIRLQTSVLIGLMVSLTGGIIVLFCGVYLLKVKEIGYAKELVPEVIKKWKK